MFWKVCTMMHGQKNIKLWLWNCFISSGIIQWSMCITLSIPGFWNLSSPCSKNENRVLEEWLFLWVERVGNYSDWELFQLELAEWVCLHPYNQQVELDPICQTLCVIWKYEMIDKIQKHVIMFEMSCKSGIHSGFVRHVMTLLQCHWFALHLPSSSCRWQWQCVLKQNSFTIWHCIVMKASCILNTDWRN